MKAMLGKVVCWWQKAHIWRRRRKDEPVGVKVCERCGVHAVVKARKRVAV